MVDINGEIVINRAPEDVFDGVLRPSQMLSS